MMIKKNSRFILFVVLFVTFSLGSIAFNGDAFRKYMVAYSQNQGGPEQEQYTYAFKWGSEGSGDGQFQRPHDVEFDAEGNVYVNDRSNGNIQKFTHDGKYIMQWSCCEAGSEEGEGKDTLYSINVVGNHIYGVDKGNDRIDIMDTNGTFIGIIDSIPGSPEEGF